MEYNVWALATTNGLSVYSGDYRSLVKLPAYENEPDSIVENYTWVRIGKNLSEDEAELLMNQYPHVSRAKC